MSEIKVNKISPRTACGTVTLGDSGDTFTIPAGATITNNGTAAGFGATGAASWDTTVKTASFTGVAGVGYFVNTTSGAITVTLPASPSAGDVIAVKDYAKTFDTNNVTLARNGSNIGGSANDATLSIKGQAVTLVYVDATQGWLVTDSGLQSDASTPSFIIATGGTITCCGDYKIHTFTGPGTFTVSCLSTTPANNDVDYLVVAGGGGGGANMDGNAGGGGGAGGFRESSGAASGCYTTSPLASPTGITVTATAYPITVGGGGTGKAAPPEGPGGGGSNSVFSTITSAGGGYGGGSNGAGGSGGSGGGGGGGGLGGPSGTGNTPSVSPPQGNNGGAGGVAVPISPDHQAGGGGGATAAGANGSPSAPTGAGGAGATTSISGSPTTYAGGGGGGAIGTVFPSPSQLNNGGAGGGGPGGVNTGTCASTLAGTANTGGGGGGVAGYDGTPNSATGGTGGSGVVIIRYRFQ